MQAPSDLFDPGHFANVRKPLDEAETMPPWVYTSEEFYRREVDRIFMKEWNFMGHVDQLPNPSDYKALEFTGVPFIICRDESGELRAFANSCRHRGAMVASGSGNAKEFMCPYHGWCYGLDGRLTATVDMDATKDFRNADYGLIPIAIDTWGGFIFVNFDRDCESLADYLGDLPDNLASHRLEDMAKCERRDHARSLQPRSAGSRRGRSSTLRIRPRRCAKTLGKDCPLERSLDGSLDMSTFDDGRPLLGRAFFMETMRWKDGGP